MMLAGGNGLMTCCWRGCQKRFKRKSLKQRFCKQQCRVNFHTRRLYRKRNPIRESKVRCKGCRKYFVVDSRALGPKKEYCQHNCKSRHGMRIYRRRRVREQKRAERQAAARRAREIAKAAEGIQTGVSSAGGNRGVLHAQREQVAGG